LGEATHTQHDLMTANSLKTGAVAIGRNEGERLKRCLESLVRKVERTVYVDSGSTDGSVAFAQSLGVEVVDLDMSRPFTAARARNAGFERLTQLGGFDCVQFVDGDCEVVEGWIEKAVEALNSRPDVAIVFGRRRERFPDASVYNKLCDIEWNMPIGEAAFCGGDALMRVEAIEQAGGYDPTFIAGEEPEMCFRIRQNGWKILRIDAEMTLHDAAMTHFSQWWKRSVRGGHAYAELAWKHGKSSPERYMVKDVRSGWIWGLLFPLAVLILAPCTAGASLMAFFVYIWKANDVMVYLIGQGMSHADARLYGNYCMQIKFPQAWGQLKFEWNRLTGKKSGLIEYK
jgi:GT2 family glycosyltransferase